ncbi:MAG: dienelactone hydrolase family protein [Thermomicrobiales bacterium]
METQQPSGPHAGAQVYVAGTPLAEAQAAMIMIHGRGASAREILSLRQLWRSDGIAYLAPQAAGATWYPQRFMEPLEANEPWLSSALALLDGLVARVGEAGLSPERVVLLGFSQGACLATEFAARNARRWGGVVGLSGGLIGPDGTPRDYPGSLVATPIFLGCSDVDFHIPKERVIESAEVLKRLGGEVTMRLYPGMGHEVNQDEIAWVQALVSGLTAK